MTNSLYGNRFIEKLVSSGYKNPTYAMAEIIDNSVDAESKNINVILVEEITREGGKNSRFISDVLFVDDGNGMTYDEINGCLKFSEGAGTSNKRIGTFGVGLPNSSIFVGRRVEVYSKDKSSGKWHYVFLDLDDQASRSEATYDQAIIKKPTFKNIDLGLDLNNMSTIIRWTKIRNIGARQPKTVIDRTEKLIGRIYRHILQDVNISFGSIIKGNSNYDIPLKNIIPYDPLFLTQSKSNITEKVWELATTTTASKIKYSDSVKNNEKFNSRYHYAKYIEGCKKNETIRPLFQKHDNYWNLKQTVKINGKTYSYIIRASFATKSIAHPGIRSGGATELGAEFRVKMVGNRYFNGGNVSFIRGKREIECGHYGLYSLTNEKERFWSVEIEFDSSLDRLMGLDYQKQNVAFKFVSDDDMGEDNVGRNENLRENEQQLVLFRNISKDIVTCRKQIMAHLADYARTFRDELKAAEKQSEGITEDMPEVEQAVFRVLPKGGAWTDLEKNEWSEFLKKKYMSLSKESISKQVEKFADGLHKTVVLYNADETGNLFDITTIRGKEVTFINTKHPFYTNVIEPLKENNQLSVFTSAIEMLICTYAYEMDSMIKDDSALERVLKKYLRKMSDRLGDFIHESQISVDTGYWKEQLQENDED